MHRSYQPITPAVSLYLQHLWDNKIYRCHRRKVQAAKSVIDNHPPKPHLHLIIKPKKLQLEAERLAIVERDNRLLLEKMAHIMRTGGRIDNVNKDYRRKSLNKTLRFRELLRITYENLAILKRIHAREPHYSHIRWAIEWQHNLIFISNITKYPNKLLATLQPKKGFKTGQHSKRASDTSHSSYLDSQLPKERKTTRKDKSPRRSPKKAGKSPERNQKKPGKPPKESQSDNEKASEENQGDNRETTPAEEGEAKQEENPN